MHVYRTTPAGAVADESGRRLRALRTRSGMTQAALAEKSGVDVRRISEYERGVAVPTLGALDALAGALGASLAAFDGVGAAERGDEK